jgi:hypothetical protein
MLKSAQAAKNKPLAAQEWTHKHGHIYSKRKDLRSAEVRYPKLYARGSGSPERIKMPDSLTGCVLS